MYQSGSSDVLAQLVNMGMKLFHKMVDTNSPFHLTLINVCFSNLHAKSDSRAAITSFFTQKSPKKVLQGSQQQVIGFWTLELMFKSYNLPQVSVNYGQEFYFIDLYCWIWMSHCWFFYGSFVPSGGDNRNWHTCIFQTLTFTSPAPNGITIKIWPYSRNNRIAVKGWMMFLSCVIYICFALWTSVVTYYMQFANSYSK